VLFEGNWPLAGALLDELVELEVDVVPS